VLRNFRILYICVEEFQVSVHLSGNTKSLFLDHGFLAFVGTILHFSRINISFKRSCLELDIELVEVTESA